MCLVQTYNNTTYMNKTYYYIRWYTWCVPPPAPIANTLILCVCVDVCVDFQCVGLCVCVCHVVCVIGVRCEFFASLIAYVQHSTLASFLYQRTLNKLSAGRSLIFWWDIAMKNCEPDLEFKLKFQRYDSQLPFAFWTRITFYSGVNDFSGSWSDHFRIIFGSFSDHLNKTLYWVASSTNSIELVPKQ